MSAVRLADHWHGDYRSACVLAHIPVLDPAPQDVVYKDIIEPLESVSVNLVPTDKDDITLFGTPEEARAFTPLGPFARCRAADYIVVTMPVKDKSSAFGSCLRRYTHCRCVAASL